MLRKLKDLYAEFRGEDWMDEGMNDNMMSALSEVATEKTIEEIKYNADILQQFHRGEIPERGDDWIMVDSDKFCKVMRDAYAVLRERMNRELESYIDVLDGDDGESEEDRAMAAIDAL